MGVRLIAGRLQHALVVGNGEHAVIIQHTLNAGYEVFQFVILNAVVVRAG